MAEPTSSGRRQVELLEGRAGHDYDSKRIADRHAEAIDDPGDGGGMPRVAVEVVRSRDRDLGIVRGEILVHADDAQEAAKILGPRGFRQIDLRNDCDLPLTRFASANAADGVREALATLRGAGISANANHIMPFSMRGKSAVPPAGADLAPCGGSDETGAGARVVVIDTGIAGDAAGRHDRWLHDITVTAANTDPLNPINRRQGDVDSSTSQAYLDDAAGHGTFVCGVVRQIAPGAEVIVMRALDSDGIGSEDVVACAIHRAGKLVPRPHVINLSLGQETLDDRPPVALAAALERLDPEIIVVVAAGNTADSVPTWPAAFRRTVAVAGLRDDGQPAQKWSKSGAWIDVSTYAEGVVSTFVGGTNNPALDTDGTLDTFSGGSPAAQWIGTSFAAPRISGIIAAGVGNGLTARQALAKLMSTGTYAPGFGVMIT